MNKKLKLALIITGSLIAILLAVFLAKTLFKPAVQEVAVTETPLVTETPAPTETAPPEHINTTAANIAVAGDVLVHAALNQEALSGDVYNYLPVMGSVKDLVSAADYAICSLGTTFSGSEEFSAYPRSVSPPSLAGSLKEAGFDLINTATSHAADSFKPGIAYTLDRLDEAGLAHVGTYRTQEERESNNGAAFADINGIKFAFLAYTADTNKIPISGFEYAVNLSTSDYLKSANNFLFDKISAELAAVKAAGADFVVVNMSWGDEFAKEPTEKQREVSDFIIKNGGDVIIGGHALVPQAMESRIVKDENGKERKGFVSYSLGNFISCQKDLLADVSSILNLTVKKDTDTGETWLEDVSYTPIMMVNLNRFTITNFDWKYRLFDLHAAINASQEGSPYDFMNDDLLEYMKSSLNTLRVIYGERFDKYTKQ
ncbi:MAG: CapA family protein [Ruminococcaceae bacterium]|nr:CapA family protein [Oscillospiraceae bacterium]